MSKYKSIGELCEHLGVSIPKLKEMLADGTIPSSTYFHHGRTYRFNVDAVEQALLQNQNAEPEQLSFDFGEGEKK